MKDIKVKKIMPRVVALLFIPFILVGCSKKSDCDVKARHVHLYKKNARNAVIQTYLNSEDMRTYDGYNWNKEYIEVTTEDLEFYKTKEKLFDGALNWDYLYNIMKSQKDYLEFYYYYTEDYYVSCTDEDGNECGYWATDTHQGWTQNPNYRGVTGKVRVVHSRFFGYRIVKKDGKYVLEKSKSVDDIRDVIQNYPYFSEECINKVNREYQVDRNKLSSLKVQDLDEFTGPDLSNTSISKAK